MTLMLTAFSGYTLHNGTTHRALSRINESVEAEDGVVELVDGTLHDAYEGAQAPVKPQPFSADLLLVYDTKENAEAQFETFKALIGNYSTLSAQNEAGTAVSCPARLLRVQNVPIFRSGKPTNNLRVRLSFQPFEDWS